MGKGLDNIIKRIEDKKRADVTALDKEFKTKKAEVLREHERRLQVELKALDRQYSKEDKTLTEGIISSANLSATRKVSDAKNQVLDKAFQNLEKRLGELPDEVYLKYLSSALKKGLDAFGQEFTVIFSEMDSDLVSKLKTQAPSTVQFKPGPIHDLGGIMLRSDKKGQVMDMQLVKLIERKRDMLRSKAAEVLFQEGAGN